MSIEAEAFALRIQNNRFREILLAIIDDARTLDEAKGMARRYLGKMPSPKQDATSQR